MQSDAILKSRLVLLLTPKVIARFWRSIHNTKLTDAQIAEIQRRFVPRSGVGALAREFGVTLQVVSNIGYGRYPRLTRASKGRG